MTEHRTLRAPGGTRGIKDGGQVVGSDLDDPVIHGLRRQRIRQAAPPAGVETEQPGHAGLARYHGHRGLRVRRTDEQARRRVLQKVADLGRGVRGVQRDVDRACTQAGQIQQYRLDRFVDLDHNAVAFLHAQALQQAQQTARRLRHLAVAQPAAVGRVEEQGIRVFGKALEKLCIEIRVSHWVESFRTCCRPCDWPDRKGTPRTDGEAACPAACAPAWRRAVRTTGWRPPRRRTPAD